MTYSTSQRDASQPRSRSASGSSSSSEPGRSSLAASSYMSPSVSSSVSNLWGGLVRRFVADSQPWSSPSDTSPAAGGSLIHPPSFQDVFNNGLAGVFTPPRTQRSASPLRPPPLEPLQLHGFREDTVAAARLLTTCIAEEIRIMVPARLTLADEWHLVYSLDQDGASLATLYQKCMEYDGRRVGFVLVVKDNEGGIFGAYLSDVPHPAPKYFGTGECFLWRASVMAALPPPPSADTTHLTGRTTTIPSHDLLPEPSHIDKPRTSGSNIPVSGAPSIRFKAFPYSGINEYYMLCEPHFLSVGAGDGRSGLWLDGGLTRGVSSVCQTFGNERLSDEGEKFGVLGVEVWVIGAVGPSP